MVQYHCAYRDLQVQNQVSPECGPQAWTPQSNVTFGGICMPFMTDMEHYLEARAADPHQSPALYKLCPDDSPFSVALSETLPKCNLVGFGGGTRQWEPISLKVQWTQNETITTYTKARFQDAFADASALSTRIEMVVTVVVILLFRHLGIVKEIKAFSWGELSDIVQEKPDEKKEAQCPSRHTHTGRGAREEDGRMVAIEDEGTEPAKRACSK